MEWRISVWSPVVSDALGRAAPLLRRGARVLELGYNTGMMACYMASRYQWKIVGYDVKTEKQRKASALAEHYGLSDIIDFRVCAPKDTLSIGETYDAVFLKSVLFHISDKTVYRGWLDWLHDRLADEGLLIAIENGKGGLLDVIYRRYIRRSRWTNNLLFDRWTEQCFRERFSDVSVTYFGRYSQFFAYFPSVCRKVQAIERKHFSANVDHCSIVSVLAKK